MKNIKVSVICIVYNHEKYLKDALEGIVMQKTNFPFEVIVHDDASTDNSAKIIHEYQRKYPDLIKPIYQVENQFSKGVLIEESVLPFCKGEYIAYCEGDDYWNCDQKLQVQIDFLDAHPDYTLCGHNDVWYSERTHEIIVRNVSKSDGDISLDNYFKKNQFSFQTASMVVRKSIVEKIPNKAYEIAQVYDYLILIWAVLAGKIRYMGKKMSTHRKDIAGSWSDCHKEEEEQIQHRHNLIALWKYVKPLFPVRYHKYVDKIIGQLYFEIDCISGTWDNFEMYQLWNQDLRKVLHIIKVRVKKYGRKK